MRGNERLEVKESVYLHGGDIILGGGGAGLLVNDIKLGFDRLHSDLAFLLGFVTYESQLAIFLYYWNSAAH